MCHGETTECYTHFARNCMRYIKYFRFINSAGFFSDHIVLFRSRYSSSICNKTHQRNYRGYCIDIYITSIQVCLSVLMCHDFSHLVKGLAIWLPEHLSVINWTPFENTRQVWTCHLRNWVSMSHIGHSIVSKSLKFSLSLRKQLW